MAKSQETFSKKEKEKKRLKKRQDKEQKKEDRKTDGKGKSFEDMIAYVDEFGNITSTPPDPTKRKVVDVDQIVIGATSRDENPEDSIFEGKVTFFNTDKGYGFIK
jgi:S-adenosylmethionine hydrolase